jgi:cytochrome c oxidase subunit 2
MSRSRRFVLSIAALVFGLSLLGGRVRADELTPGQGATDQLFYLVLVPAVGIGVFVMALVAYAVIKFRVRKGHTVGPMDAKTHDRKLETLWTIVPAIILVVVGVAAFQTLVVTDTIPQNPDAVVTVTARQWTWNFTVRYAGGLIENSTGGFTVKEGQTVKLVFMSIDVAHAFWIPAFDLKLDVIPGHLNVYWFKALKAGNYEIRCAEFCGLGHYSMVATLHVIPA